MSAERPVITIVGGGWSVANVAVDKLPGSVMAVNDSALHLPRWDCAVSMDRLWAENRIETVHGLADQWQSRIFVRSNALQNIDVAKWPLVEPFECDHESSVFTAAPGRLNGTNSGGCALNLAWRLLPSKVYLLGFDMNRAPDGRAYWYSPYPWVTKSKGATSDGKYGRWSQQFIDAKRAFDLIGCQVYNVSPSSAIDCWPKLTPAQFLKETR